MVLLLFFHDLGNCFDGGLVLASKYLQLLAKVPEDNALDRHSSCRDRVTAEQPCDDTENESTRAAKPVAPTAPNTATLQLSPKDAAVFLLVRLVLCKLRYQRSSRDVGQQDLTSVDAHSAVLAGVIDLQHAAAKCFVRIQTRAEFHWGPNV